MTQWLILIAAAAMGCAPAEPEGNAMPTSSPARDGDIAIREELDSARRAGTIAAYNLFIARHPDHPLAEIARREREQIERQAPPHEARRR